MSKEPTKEEQNLKAALEALGVRVLSQVYDGHKHIDLSIPDAKINIEVDGIRHMTDPHKIVSDLMRSHYSDDLGYYTIHIQNDYIHDNLEKISKAIAEAAKIREEQINSK